MVEIPTTDQQVQTELITDNKNVQTEIEMEEKPVQTVNFERTVESKEIQTDEFPLKEGETDTTVSTEHSSKQK